MYRLAGQHQAVHNRMHVKDFHFRHIADPSDCLLSITLYDQLHTPVHDQKSHWRQPNIKENLQILKVPCVHLRVKMKGQRRRNDLSDLLYHNILRLHIAFEY